MQNAPVESIEERARRAKALLSDPLVIEALENARRVQLNTIADSLLDQPDVRERAYYMIQAVEELKSELQNFISEASIAARRNNVY